jgi:iron(III) transport system substrate-binding protein
LNSFLHLSRAGRRASLRASCGRLAAVAVTLSIGIGAAGAAAGQAMPREWDRTVAAAKKEGRLNLYVGRYGTEPLLNEFRREYPDIKISSVNGQGSQLGARILTESRAGKIIADIFSGGAATNYNILYKGKVLDSIKAALMLPEVTDPTKWYGGAHFYADPENRSVFVYIANPSTSGLYYNTTLVNPREFKSYWDLLNPKWKGKIVSQDPAGNGMGPPLVFYYRNPELGPEFVRRFFGAMDLTFGRDRRQITDWLASGKFPICLACREATKARGQGLPVDEFDTGEWKEGIYITSGGGSLSLIKDAPHPNAARVFINWFLSRKGQIALQKYPDLYGEAAPNSRRIDIPKDDLPAESRLVKGRKYLDISDAELQDTAPVLKLINEVSKAGEAK